ncbi:hypothetical protein PBY51_020867 [Eleginops maclovinus]|uniref:Reverse transcriptase domain-containing protein n=1 Tax=Eleginops maclovinus TaxID=56733 RepID=A0AAN8ANQ0_ELEMC|nr:hypothetical protein PBY51_020867 [Eleginops maclovinus]
MEATLSYTGVNSNKAALNRGLVSIPTSARRLTPWATPEKNRVQPLSRSKVPEPTLCCFFNKAGFFVIFINDSQSTSIALAVYWLTAIDVLGTSALQFAYQSNIGVEDALIYMLHRANSHLEKPHSSLRILFFDFSSAFNTIQPQLLAEKLSLMQVDHSLVDWITDYLTSRPQYVRLQGSVSDVLVSNTGAPQGTLQSPFLFPLYTTDFRFNSGSCHLQKFSDDSSIVSCITDDNEEEYRALVENSVGWCDNNHLKLNISKTKELVLDFRRSMKRSLTPITIRGEEVEVVNSYKFLGVQLNNKLDWSDNTDALFRKAQSKLFFLKGLRSFNVCTRLLQTFYQSVVASVLFFAGLCWGGNTNKKDAERLNKLVRKANSVVGVKLDNLEEVAEGRTRRKLDSILDYPSHPLHAELVKMRSTVSIRLITPKHSTKRLGNPFVPVAIRLHNKEVTK